jgi:hypothetical protein
MTKRQALCVLGFGFAFSFGVLYRQAHLNGLAHSYWEWPWRNLGNLRTSLALLLPGLLIGFVIWRMDKKLTRLWLWVGLLALSSLLLQMMGMTVEPEGLDRIERIIASAQATGYYSDAVEIHGLHAWMSSYHAAPTLRAHSAIHPAGPILFFYLFVKSLGAPRAAFVSGAVIGLIASTGVFVIYRFAGLWKEEPRGRLLACIFYALLPGLTVFLPELDQIYPLFSMLLVLHWLTALDRASPKYAIIVGAILFLGTFFAYNLLAIGGFILLYSLYWLSQRAWNSKAWTQALHLVAIALGTCVILYFLLWIATGYRPLASFATALRTQAYISQQVLKRPYGTFLLINLYDFAASGGVIVLPIVLCYCRNLLSEFSAARQEAALTLLGLASILVVDLSGLFPGETARTWLFLQPLVVVPAGQAISRLTRSWILVIFGLQWWILVCLKSKMTFIVY